MTTQYKITRADLADLPEAPDPKFTTRRIAYINHYGSAAPAKPANAQAASAHTPEAFHCTNLQFNDLPGFARDTILALEQQLDKTAAERDRLNVLVNSNVQGVYELTVEREQLREQVKTLLAACKDVADLDLAAVDCGMIPTEVWKLIHAKMRAAIASVESEQAK
jgi:hypothetical protein